jgi:hypothetical protein
MTSYTVVILSYFRRDACVFDGKRESFSAGIKTEAICVGTLVF